MDHLLSKGGTAGGQPERIPARRPAQAGASFIMTWSLSAYRAAIAAARAVVPLASLGSPKLRLGVEGRARSFSEFAAWGRSQRDQSHPLVLFHGASAGELRHCEPVIRRLRARHPDWQLAVTTFSPSGIGVARALPADVSGFLPWDTESLMTPLLDALRPSAIVFGKLDLWPVLALLAERRGIRLGLIAGAVRAGSGRLRWPATSILAPALCGPSGRRRYRPGGCNASGHPRREAGPDYGDGRPALRRRARANHHRPRCRPGNEPLSWRDPLGRATNACCSRLSRGSTPGAPRPD